MVLYPYIFKNANQNNKQLELEWGHHLHFQRKYLISIMQNTTYKE